MLEYHGTCTILAINRIHESVQLKLLMGGIRECIQDNFPLGKADWINANILIWGAILLVHTIIVLRHKFSFFKKWEERQIQKFIDEDRGHVDKYK